MYAIVEVLGDQVRVEPGGETVVPHMSDKSEGDEITLNKVLLISGEGEPIVGRPSVEGASVSATVTGHFKDDKVIVFKKKRRTGYHKKQGHRQQYTRIRIDEIKTP